MSRSAFLMAPDIHAAAQAAHDFGWVRLGSMRFATPDKQDVVLAENPGRMRVVEFPTDIYREKHWDQMWSRWDQGWRDEIDAMAENGRIRFVNEVEGMLPVAADA